MLKRSFLNRDLFGAFLVSRAVILFAALTAPILVADLNAPHIPWPNHAEWMTLLHRAFHNADSGWYEQIARFGYEHRAFSGARQTNWGYFPLFPLLLRVVGASTPAGALLGAVLGYSGLALVHAIVVRLRDEETAARTVKLMCFYPISFVLSSYRPEGLLLLLSAATYLALMDERYWLAGLFGFLTALTRMPGVLIAGMIGFECLRNHRWRPSPALLAAVLPLLGLALFSAHLWTVTGDPLAWLHIQSTAWDNKVSFPLATLTGEFLEPEIMKQGGWSFTIPSYVMLAAAIPTAIVLARGRTLGLGLYTLAQLIFPLCAGGVAGVVRYVIPLFGLFMLWAAKPERRLRYELLLGAFAVLLGLWGALLGLNVHSATG